MFDREAFVRDVRTAAEANDPIGAVQEVVSVAIRDGSAIDAALGTEIKAENEILFRSDTLTIQRVIWPPGLRSSVHDHRMWAVVGVYAGEERNRLYERSDDGIREQAVHAIPEKDVLVLDADAIHSVENPDRNWTAGLHVYAGDILGIERSAWGPDGREIPFAEVDAARREIFKPWRELAAKRGRIDGEARYVAFTALMQATELARRYPTPDEAREVLAKAWNLDD